MNKKTNILIFLSILLSVFFGNILSASSLFYLGFIEPVGKMFIILLKFIVAPCVFFNIISGILSFNDFERLKKIGLLTISFFFITTLLAIFISFGVNFLMSDFYVSGIETPQVSSVPTKNLKDIIFNLIPKNIVEPFANGSMLQIIIFSLAFGISILFVKNEKVREFLKLQIDSLSIVFNNLMSWIIKLAPIGIFCLLTPIFFKENSIMIKPLIMMILSIYVCFVLHFILVYFPILKIVLKQSFLYFLKVAFPSQVFAFCSNSSLTTLPLNLECAEKLGVSKSVKDFVIPFGNTVNMDGAAIIQSSILIFLLTYLNIGISFSTLLMIILCIFLISVGAAGIPGGGIVLLCMIFPYFNIPSEYVEVMLGISYLYETTATMLNVTGDLIGALFVDKFSKQ